MQITRNFPLFVEKVAALNMKDLPEDKLINMAIDGYEEAWKELYRRYYGRVKRVVAWRKWSFRYAEVEEIIQEVFLELIRALPNFRGEASLATFLTRLAKNKCISVLRRKGAQKRAREEFGFIFDDRRSDDDQERRIPVESPHGRPEESLLFSENASELIQALRRLPEECRDIIRKRYFEELSYRDICELLDMPLGTVCSRLKRCLSRLKEIFEENSR